MSWRIPHRCCTLPALLLSLVLLTGCTDDDSASNIVMKTATEMTLLPTMGEQATFEFEAPAAWTATTT